MNTDSVRDSGISTGIVVVFVISLALFIACSFFQKSYQPIQDIIDMDAPGTEGIVTLHMDNPVMRYVAAEETAKAYLMGATVGVARRYGFSGAIYLCVFILFSSLWSLAEGHFFVMRNYDGLVNQALIGVSHYFVSFDLMYLLTLLTFYIARFIATATKGEMGILLAVLAFILYVVFLLLSLPFFFAWFLDWLGEGLFIFLMFFVADRISSEAAVFGADTSEKVIADPRALIVFALIFIFDRLWAEFARPFLYSSILSKFFGLEL